MLSPLRARAKELDTTVETLAIAAALAQPWADVALSGAVTVEQLDSHLAAPLLSGGAGSFETLAEPADVYWRKRSAMVWS